MFLPTHELKEFLLKIESYETIGELDRRQTAIFSAVSIAQQCGYKAGVRPLGNVNGNVIEDPEFPIPEWASPIVAYIELPTGEIAYFLKKHDVEWDQHARPDKLDRIRKFVFESEGE